MLKIGTHTIKLPGIAKAYVGTALVYINAIWRTITGTAPLTLPDAKAGSMQSLIQTGKVAQSGTPSPSAPVDVVCNNGTVRILNFANMAQENLDIGYYINNNGTRASAVSNFYTKGYIAVRPNTTYTMHTSSSINYFNMMEYGADKTFIKRTLYGSTSTPAGDTTTFTTGDTTYFLRWGSNMDGNTMSYSKATSITWMLSEGATAQEYVPFGTPTVVGTPEEITICGIALVRTDNIVNGYGLNSSSGARQANANRCYTCLGYYPAGMTITVRAKMTSMGGNLYCYISDDPSTITFNNSTPMSEATNIGDGWYERTATSTSDGYLFIQCTVDKESALSASWSATQPSQTAHIEDLYAVGDYADTQDIISGAVTRNVGIKVFDGTENWSTGGSSVTYFYNTMNDINAAAEDELICSHFGVVARNTLVANNCCIRVSRNGILFSVAAGSMTLADWEAYLAAQYAARTPVIVLYPLATAQTETADPQSLSTSQGANVIDVTANVNGIELAATYSSTTT